MSKIVSGIKHVFHKHPIISNSVLYGTLFVAAEFSQQTVSKKVLPSKSEPYDKPNLVRCAIYGTAIQGPILTIWYRFLDRKIVGTSTKLIAKKLIVDQFFFTPQLLILFYIAMSIMEHKEDILEECKQKFVPTFKNSCMFWLPAQTINFTLIPSTFRIAYIGLASFGWVNILCFLKRQEY